MYQGAAKTGLQNSPYIPAVEQPLLWISSSSHCPSQCEMPTAGREAVDFVPKADKFSQQFSKFILMDSQAVSILYQFFKL